MQNLTIYIVIYYFLALAHIVIIHEEVLRAAHSKDFVFVTPVTVTLVIFLINIHIGLKLIPPWK